MPKCENYYWERYIKKYFVQRWIISVKQVYEGSKCKLMCPKKVFKL